jgi:hypothetical protein
MLLTIDLVARLQAESVKLRAQLSALDRELTRRYGDRYEAIKQKFAPIKTRYQQTRAEAESSGTIPLEQKQAVANRRFATAGSRAAHQESAIKQKIRDFWHAVTNA